MSSVSRVTEGDPFVASLSKDPSASLCLARCPGGALGGRLLTVAARGDVLEEGGNGALFGRRRAWWGAERMARFWTVFDDYPAFGGCGEVIWQLVQAVECNSSMLSPSLDWLHRPSRATVRGQVAELTVHALVLPVMMRSMDDGTWQDGFVWLILRTLAPLPAQHCPVPVSAGAAKTCPLRGLPASMDDDEHDLFRPPSTLPPFPSCCVTWWLPLSMILCSQSHVEKHPGPIPT